MMEQNNKQEWVKLGLAVALAVAGVALMVLGFYAVPIGEISASVLTGAGEMFVFSASVLGIKLTYDFKLQKLLGSKEKTDE
jgi:hypothetical protein